MRVLVAPDKFRGTLSAEDAARAIAAGWARADPSAEVTTLPMADGGEGTLDVLAGALGGTRHTVTVTGPLGDPTPAEFAIVESHAGSTAVIEMARASGVTLLSPVRRDPKRTTTRGTGELLLAATRLGARKLIVCVGGSATNDAGGGMAQAVGVRLLDRAGRELPGGALALLRLAWIDMTGLDRSVAASDIIVATDVQNPLVGPNGASAVYGPQKGASPDDVDVLDRALRHFAAVVNRDVGIDLRYMRGAGAAGGLAGGLVAFLGAKLRRGVEVVMEAVGMREQLTRCDLVVTGEGEFDRQSLDGKVPAGVIGAAEEAGVPVIVLCGGARAESPSPRVRVVSLVDRFGRREAFARARECLEELAGEIARGGAEQASAKSE